MEGALCFNVWMASRLDQSMQFNQQNVFCFVILCIDNGIDNGVYTNTVL